MAFWHSFCLLSPEVSQCCSIEISLSYCCSEIKSASVLETKVPSGMYYVQKHIWMLKQMYHKYHFTSVSAKCLKHEICHVRNTYVIYLISSGSSEYIYFRLVLCSVQS